MAREARQMRPERPEHQKAPADSPRALSLTQAPPQRPGSKAPPSLSTVRPRHWRAPRPRTNGKRSSSADRAAAVRAEKEAWKAQRREQVEGRAKASAALEGAFQKAAASPHERVLAVLSDMAQAWPQDRKDLWLRAEAIAVRDHQDRLTEIRKSDDPRRGDYRRADAARSALLGEQGYYTNEQVAARAAALKESEANRLASRQTAAAEAKRIHGWVAEKHPQGASPEQYDAIAAKVRHPRLVAIPCRYWGTVTKADKNSHINFG